jgi:signal transduction histidine kinase
LAVHDVRSERAQREHAEDMAKEFKASEEAKSDFVAMVAHQLRSPLGGIRSSAAMLEAGDYGAVPTKAREAAILMRSAAARLLALAETYLNVSKLDMGRFETTPIPTNVRSDVQEIVDEMASAAQTKGLRLHVTFAPGFPEVLVLDQEVLRHVVFNLLDNAVKYTEQGMVSLALAKTDTDVVIEVWDTGPGMSQEEIHHLFQKFHRGSAGNAHATDGTGLGLFIVRRLVEAAHGHIAVTSQGADTGTTFRVTLPAHEVV